MNKKNIEGTKAQETFNKYSGVKSTVENLFKATKGLSSAKIKNTIDVKLVEKAINRLVKRNPGLASKGLKQTISHVPNNKALTKALVKGLALPAAAASIIGAAGVGVKKAID